MAEELSTYDVPLTSVPSMESERAGAFYQARLRLWAKVCAIASGAFWLKDMVALLLEGKTLEECVGMPPYVLHATATLVLVATYLLCRRRRPFSLTFLRALDATVLVLTMALFAGMGFLISTVFPRAGSLLAILINGTVLTTRALLVPDRPRRAVLLNAVAVAPLILVSFAQLGMVADAPPLEPVASAALWGATFVMIATVASRVLYGLRARVREARQLGQYTLEELLGEGGMGKVYRASHAMLRRPTAIKLLPPEKVSDKHIVRFEREVQLTARLTHPNTISVFDYGRTPDGVFYYAMEYLEGINLEDLVQRFGPQPPARVIHVLRQACGALAEAHGVGLIHRDVKPANVFLTLRGGDHDVVKVLDFGLVKDLTRDDGASVEGNVLTGTPLYMAPEAIKGGTADERTDLYALGAVAYYLLAGEPVFSGNTIVEVCAAHLHEAPVPPSERLPQPVPQDLEALVLRCLAKDPAERPTSAQGLRDALDACADAGQWDEQTAAQWWREQMPPTSGDRPRAESPRTVDVDLTLRAG